MIDHFSKKEYQTFFRNCVGVGDAGGCTRAGIISIKTGSRTACYHINECSPISVIFHLKGSWALVAEERVGYAARRNISNIPYCGRASLMINASGRRRKIDGKDFGVRGCNRRLAVDDSVLVFLRLHVGGEGEREKRGENSFHVFLGDSGRGTMPCPMAQDSTHSLLRVSIAKTGWDAFLGGGPSSAPRPVTKWTISVPTRFVTERKKGCCGNCDKTAQP